MISGRIWATNNLCFSSPLFIKFKFKFKPTDVSDDKHLLSIIHKHDATASVRCFVFLFLFLSIIPLFPVVSPVSCQIETCLRFVMFRKESELSN